MAIENINKQTTDIVVLIPHYNNVGGLKCSLESISQSRIPVDVLIVDDGSINSPNEQELQAIHPSTTLLLSPKNGGIEAALNRGFNYILEQTQWKYIARLDAGDISLPDRFLKQKEYLDHNPSIFLVGSWVRFIDTQGKLLWNFCPPEHDSEIRKSMFLNNMFCHPAVMFRTEVLTQIGLYPTRYPRAEDYAFFFDIIRRFQGSTVPEFLVETVYTPGGISVKHRRQQLKSRIRIILSYFDWTPWAFYGLFRNIVLLLTPLTLTENLKAAKKH